MENVRVWLSTFAGRRNDKVSKIVPRRKTCVVGAAVREGICCCQNNAIKWFELFTQLGFVPCSVHVCVFPFVFPVCLLILGLVLMCVIFRSFTAFALCSMNILDSLCIAHPWHPAVSRGTAVPLLLSKDVCGVSDCLALCCCR